jgi:hypothetical protein
LRATSLPIQSHNFFCKHFYRSVENDFDSIPGIFMCYSSGHECFSAQAYGWYLLGFQLDLFQDLLCIDINDHNYDDRCFEHSSWHVLQKSLSFVHRLDLLNIADYATLFSALLFILFTTKNA